MPIQDLTPQLRTRLSRVERAVGWFITMATVLLFIALGYYFYYSAQRRGWFDTKIAYQTSVNDVSLLKEGDPVKVMGKIIGKITKIELNDPGEYYGATVFFQVRHPYEGYIWLDSKIRTSSDFLSGRYLEVIKGYEGAPTVVKATSGSLLELDHKAVVAQVDRLKSQITKTNATLSGQALNAEVKSLLNLSIRSNQNAFYLELGKAEPFWIEPLDAPALTARIESVVDMVQDALPNILALTNQLAATLNNASAAVANANATIQQTQPILSNINVITANLRNPRGSLGEWALPTNINTQLELTMRSAEETIRTANVTLANTDTNVTKLTESLSQSLDQLANVTSNLNQQVLANTNLLKNISDSITHSDELIQGLKRHWFLRSAFKTNKEPAKVTKPFGRR
jgi:ABC-type transporter Mla subunit MlaD